MQTTANTRSPTPSRATNRRRFLKNSAFADIGFRMVGTGSVAENKSPNERLNIGSIGVAGRGGGDMMAVSSENIVALCDADQRKLGGAAKRFPKAANCPEAGS